MATVRLRSGPLSLFLVVFLGLFLGFATAASSSGSKQPSKPASDLICHTSNPDECYPRVFQPTDEFQIVRDDQELPNGLHVRLNIWTGQKEAKINVPDETDPALEGLPVEQAVVLVEQEQLDTPQIPKGAPEYDPIGKIKEPPQQSGAVTFAEAFKMLKSGTIEDVHRFDTALEEMEELSHDIYYGLQITEDSEVVKALFCQMGQHDGRVIDGVTPRDQQAAAILAGALSNNPSALKEVVKVWDNLMDSNCPQGDVSVRKSFYSSFVPAENDATATKQSPSKVKAKVSAINGLIKDKSIRKDFLENGGMKRLLEVLIPEGKEWTTAQRKVGQLVLDTFLDEDMGAKLGQWPKTAKSDNKECKALESTRDEGCWDYHVERIMKANKGNGGHWSKDLHDRLAKARKMGNKAPKHEEL
ncbi:Nucleotide exchange factor SIL1 [Cladobotryum mycophilum]|uniref:Nucleotide exchange factor SIL1 n=1 Tax=Cladobotryum mycophilum TaxID=491253 RepID=A0ABR0S5C6_9HYPO